VDSSAPILSLYVHVPFCAAKCRYCDFFSVPVDREDRGATATVAAVVERTLGQLGRFLERFPRARFATAYVGGGTPSVLPPPLLDRLLGPIALLRPAEWTVEANPESLDRDFLRACRDAGVTRLSVGLQSMDDRLLALLGRPGSADDNRRARQLLAVGWDRELSFDLIAGIPGQTRDGLLADVRGVAAAGVGHVSFYSLTVEAGTPLERQVASGAVRRNPPDHDDELWLAGRAALGEAGLGQYEVSNFARTGKRCRHNLRYWHLEPYLGIGPGAVSTLPPALASALAPVTRGAPVVRLTVPRDVVAFLGGAGPEVEAVDAGSFLLESLMVGLRLVDGVSRALFRDRFGCGFEELAPGLWRRWVDRGLAADDPARLRLTDRGLLGLDPLLVELAGALGGPPPDLRWPPEY
jgi:oxygen-independent coproporphyrinogen-3 oxidase